MPNQIIAWWVLHFSPPLNGDTPFATYLFPCFGMMSYLLNLAAVGKYFGWHPLLTTLFFSVTALFGVRIIWSISMTTGNAMVQLCSYFPKWLLHYYGPHPALEDGLFDNLNLMSGRENLWVNDMASESVIHIIGLGI